MSPRLHEHDDGPDHDPEGCLCDFELEAGAAVSDLDLPPAAGGVALQADGTFDETLDGCDVDFTQGPTRDADLPPAAGGVA